MIPAEIVALAYGLQVGGRESEFALLESAAIASAFGAHLVIVAADNSGLILGLCGCPGGIHQAAPRELLN